MCLAIPGRITSIESRDGVRMGRVDFSGIVRDTCLDYLPEAQIGTYVMVHVGFAISAVNEEEARRTYRFLETMGELDEFRSASEEGRDEIP